MRVCLLSRGQTGKCEISIKDAIRMSGRKEALNVTGLMVMPHLSSVVFTEGLMPSYTPHLTPICPHSAL